MTGTRIDSGVRPCARDALEETAGIMSDSETLAAIEASLGELSRGEAVTLEELRAELDERRAPR
jgi:predicted transcriptional regulator